MTKSIYRCTKCKKYTLDSEKCPYCKEAVVSPQPARFSLEKEKKYSVYRRQMIKNSMNKN